MNGTGIMVVTSGLGFAILVVFILAIRVSYAIEKVVKLPSHLPRYTNIWATMLGLGVDRSDTETMALVVRLRKLMAVIACLFGILAVIGMTSA